MELINEISKNSVLAEQGEKKLFLLYLFVMSYVNGSLLKI